MNAIAFENWKQKWSDRYQSLNDAIYRGQEAIGDFYSKYFTLYAALFFSMGAGAVLGLTGEDCYGKIPFDSPVFWCLFLGTLFFLFQTFILIRLTLGRLIRLITVAVCGHYLSYQAYGFWSMANVESVIDNLSSIPASRINSVALGADMSNLINGVKVCKPYAYANITYGHFWIVVPAIALIMICFFAGGMEEEVEA